MKNLLALLLVSALLWTQAFAADLSITAANLLPSSSAITRDAPAGVAITAGQLVYKDTATGTMKLADANGASVLIRTPTGLAANSAGIGQNVRYIISDPDLTLGATTANGTIYVLSATPGGIAPAADLASGWYPLVVAVGSTTTKVSFRVSGLQSLIALP